MQSSTHTTTATTPPTTTTPPITATTPPTTPLPTRGGAGRGGPVFPGAPPRHRPPRAKAPPEITTAMGGARADTTDPRGRAHLILSSFVPPQRCQAVRASPGSLEDATTPGCQGLTRLPEGRHNARLSGPHQAPWRTLQRQAVSCCGASRTTLPCRSWPGDQLLQDCPGLSRTVRLGLAGDLLPGVGGWWAIWPVPSGQRPWLPSCHSWTTLSRVADLWPLAQPLTAWAWCGRARLSGQLLGL